MGASVTGASRPAAVVLAAALSACIGQAVLAPVAHAQVAQAQVTQAQITGTQSTDPQPVGVSQGTAPAEPSTEPLRPSLPLPADGAASASPPAPDAPAQVTAVPPPPSDPLAAAVAARLADPAPLLARLTTKEREAIQAFYALGAFKPAWIVDGAFSAAAKAVMGRLAQAGEDGLDPLAYPAPVLGTAKLTEAEVAQADLKLSSAVVLYARDARGGRISLANLSRLITPTLDLPAPDAVLGRLATAGTEAGALLQRFNPDQPGYRALKARLAAGRGHSQPPVSGTLRLPAGPVLKLGMRDPRVPAIRTHFDLETRTAGTLDAAPGEPDAYDQAVVAAVGAFQKRRGLPANGHLTAQTVAALASSEGVAPTGTADEAALIVNMERWRWLPSDLGPDYVMVNIPEFRLRVVRDGRQRDEARVIVGKTESPTPIFSGAMEYAVVNPSWHVPPSILKNEFLPGLARDPNYAARRGYQVVYSGKTVSVRQPPGERNALGFIKFMFPNNHAVYLHDTPNRSLFAASQRALSHGCVRVDDPFRFADSVLPEEWSSSRLKGLIGKGERTIRLTQKLPVHLAYFTAYVDDGGAYRTLPDLYGHDARMKAALGLGGAGPAMVKLSPEPRRRPAQVAPTQVARPVADPAPASVPRRSARAATAERPSNDFGEPGLWTPAPSRPRSWW
ncbi:peptidoglycan-binding protein [Methylobacterium sp. Leaf399]|uniref:L,D-transpeptidase family protein n=1 Tax=Methylobacterium sp. Leaf399 TaxID=1736364 RepID=UPI0006FFD2F0|nr:L,D-transpeptidase family protein [Methylobacterium sp. Leaf399]KQT15375.1 peptidoglycan-binding protein [Methylobacterium sp. Leaf399]